MYSNTHLYAYDKLAHELYTQKKYEFLSETKQ